MPTARQEFATAVVGGKIYVIGGSSSAATAHGRIYVIGGRTTDTIFAFVQPAAYYRLQRTLRAFLAL